METYYCARATLNSRLPAKNAAPVAFNSGIRHLGKHMGEFAAGIFSADQPRAPRRMSGMRRSTLQQIGSVGPYWLP